MDKRDQLLLEARVAISEGMERVADRTIWQNELTCFQPVDAADRLIRHNSAGDPNLIANFEAAMALKGCGFMDEEINALYYEQLVKDRVQDEVLVRMLLDDTTAALERELNK